MKTVIMSRSQAEWAGNAVSVAGGWIAVGLERVRDYHDDDTRTTLRGGLLALVPDSWTTYVRTISLADALDLVRRESIIWAGIDEERAADAKGKLASLES